MRRFLKISSALAITLFILFVIAGIIIKVYFPPEKVKALIVSEAAKALGRNVSVGKVNISLFHGIDIHDIYIGENRILGDIPFVRVKRVAVGYSFSEIFHKRIVFNRVAVEEPEIYIRSRKGRLAFSDLIKRPPPEEKPKKPLPFTVILQRGEIKGLNIFYDAEDVKAAIKGLNISSSGSIYPFNDIDVTVSSRDKDNIGLSAKGLVLKSGLFTDLQLKSGLNTFSAKGNVFLNGVRAGMKGKSLHPLDANMGIDLTGDMSKGAEINELSLAVGGGNKVNLSGFVKDLKGLKGIDIKLTGESDLAEVSRIAERFLPLPVGGFLKIETFRVSGNAPESLRLKSKVSLKDGFISYKGITLPLHGFVKMEAGRGSDKEPIKVKVSGSSTINALQAGPLSVRESTATFSVSSDDLLRRKAVIDVGFELKEVNIRKGDIVLREEIVKGAVSASGDLKNGDITVKRVEIIAPEFLKAGFDGEIKRWGQDLAIDAKIEEIDHGKAMERLPASIKDRLPKMEVLGKSSLVASISGGIPVKDNNPWNVAGTFMTRRLGLSIPDKGIKIRNSESDIDFDLSQAVQWVSGTLKIGSIEKSGLLEGPLTALAGFELLADGSDLKIKSLSVKIPEKATSLTVSGEVPDYTKGLRPNLDISFSFNSLKKVDLLKGISAQGAVTFKGAIISGKEKELALNGGLKFDHLAASYMDRAAIKDLSGEIKISQKVGYAKGVELMTGSGEKGAEMPYAASLSGLLRPYVKKGYDLTMGSLSFDGYEAGPLSMDIAWDNGNLKVDRYDLALFEGGITGRMQAAYIKGLPEYSLFSNIAGISFDKFFKDKKGGEEMEVNADLNLKGRGTDIEGEVNVTKIGKDILDRGLLRIDPNESNPQIVDIRSKLNTLGWVPKEVSLWIRHGELNMDITLQRREVTLLNIVGLEKIPVRRVPVGYLIKKGLKKAD